MSDSKGAAIDEILDTFQQDYEVIIQDSDLDNIHQLAEYQAIKKEAKQAILAILAQEVNKARISELVLWFDMVKIADLSLSLEQDMEYRLNELKRKAGLV